MVLRTVGPLEGDYIENGIPDIALDAIICGDCHIDLFLFGGDIMLVLDGIQSIKFVC